MCQVEGLVELNEGAMCLAAGPRPIPVCPNLVNPAVHEKIERSPPFFLPRVQAISPVTQKQLRRKARTPHRYVEI
jgi:hypothetical protein